MTKALLIQSSPNPNGVSNIASEHLKQKLIDSHNIKDFSVRDLSANPVPHLDGKTIGAFFQPDSMNENDYKKAISLSNELVEEIKQSDVIVLASPMWNLSIPSVVKAYIDHIVRAGLTFQYTETGPQGLLNGKKAYIVLATGGDYTGDLQGYDFATNYLKGILGFIGITDVEVLTGHSAAIDADASIENVKQQINKL
ncbi:MAG: FMN-dependent NADH-azoreductase [Alphaproteobacteria bacterium]